MSDVCEAFCLFRVFCGLFISVHWSPFVVLSVFAFGFQLSAIIMNYAFPSVVSAQLSRRPFFELKLTPTILIGNPQDSNFS